MTTQPNRTLVLNASGEPHAIIPHEEAICLLLADKVMVIEESDVVFHSQKLDVAAPSVIQLRRYVHLPPDERTILLTRKNVCARDRHVCAYTEYNSGCDEYADTIDHVIPRSKGGKHEWTNVTASCRPCNQRKGRRTLDELGWELKRKPFRPRGISVYLRAMNPLPEWEPYLS